MTEKLYYQDSFLQTFTATVEACVQGKNGWEITLNRTAFYPEGGGQPADHGTLDGVSVIDTRKQGETVLHICDSPLPEGKEVIGKIDFDRRFLLMQLHSGEHIVSGLLCRRFHCDNVGFHIGQDAVTIDFNTQLTSEDLAWLEHTANRYIWENHPIAITYPTAEELAVLPYRSKKTLTGQVRIVTWPGADCCACCGTHLTHSGQVGLVKLLSCQKFREGVRIEMVVGSMALRYLSAVWEQNGQISHLLSAKPQETAAAVKRLQQELYRLQGRVNQLEEADFAAKAAAHANKGDVFLIETPLSPESLRKLCNAVQVACGGRCAVFAGENDRYQYAIGQPEGDLRPLAKKINATLRGKGGGKPDFVQGSVQATEAEIKQFFA